jgi:hypothetical protein
MVYDPFWRARPLQYLIAFVYSLAVAVLWMPAFMVRWAGRLLREIGTENWRRANGSITGGEVKVIHGWVVDYALGRLDYSYRVSGEYYAGCVIRQFPDEQAAWDFADGHQGKSVVVRYKDENAASSVVRNGDQEPSWDEGRGSGLFAMVWQHWRDELRGGE